MTNQGKLPLLSFVNSSRNYLILIVSLFAFICFFVGITATGQTLETLQRWILIVFIILFATVGMSFSIWLILRQSRQNYVRKDNRESNWKASATENQRRKLNTDVREIAESLNVSELSSVFSAFIVAQDLALRQIQSEAKEIILRNQSIGSIDFDAVIFKQDIIVCVEIAFLVSADISQAKVNEVLKKISSAKKTVDRTGKDTKFRLLLVLITQLAKTDEAKLRSTLVQKFPPTTVDVDIRLFDFESLQKIYAMD